MLHEFHLIHMQIGTYQRHQEAHRKTSLTFPSMAYTQEQPVQADGWTIHKSRSDLAQNRQYAIYIRLQHILALYMCLRCLD